MEKKTTTYDIKENVLLDKEVEFFRVRVLERDEDKSKFIDIRKYVNGFPTKKGIRLRFHVYHEIKNILDGYFKL